MEMLPGSFGERRGIGVVVADEAHALFGVELLAVEGDDAGRFLAAMLESMQAERRQRRGIGMAENAEHAAFLVQRIAVEFIVEAWRDRTGSLMRAFALTRMDRLSIA